MWALSLLAADDPLTRSELLYGVAGIAGALVVGAVVISLTDKWRRRAAAPMQADTDVLTTYRELYEQGELTEAEYTELRRKVIDKVKNAPAPVIPPAPDPTGRPDPAKFAIPTQSAPAAKLDPPAPPPPPPEPPAPPGTS